MPSSKDANLILLAMEPGALNFRFSHLWPHITPDHWVFPKGVRPCSAAVVLRV